MDNNGKPETILEAYEEIWKRVKKIFTGQWDKLPYRVQSVVIIGIWIFIIGVWDYQIFNNRISILDLPLAFICISFTGLGLFYIIEELRGKLRKRKP